MKTVSEQYPCKPNMIAASMDAILAINEDQNSVQFNAAAERVFGYQASEIISKPIDILVLAQFRRNHSMIH